MFGKLMKPLGAGITRRAFSSVAPVANPFRRAGILAASGAFAVGSALALQRPAEASGEVDYKAVRKAINSILDQESHDDGHLGPILVRLAWHASGTYDIKDGSGGSNGATMRFAPESNWGANAGLHVARDVLEHVKARFPGISYGDLWTLAAVEAIKDMGGPEIPWSPGRVDALDGSKIVPDGRLPDAAQGAQHLRDIFYKMGMNDQEIVALSGAHTLGRCHPTSSGFTGPWTRAPTTFSNLYFQELLHNKWTPKKWNGPFQLEDPTGDLMMLPSDMALLSDPVFRKWVEIYAQDEARFSKDFSASFSKLIALGVPVSAGKFGGLFALGAVAAASLSRK